MRIILTVILLMSTLLTGCSGRIAILTTRQQPQSPENARWENMFADLREGIYAENMYIKAHRGQDSGAMDGLIRLSTDLNSSYPPESSIGLHIRLSDMAICLSTIPDSIYYYGVMNSGRSNPTTEIENCHKYGNVGGTK